MRKALFAATALLALSTLAACGRHRSASAPPAQASAPPTPQTKMPEPKPATEASAVSGAEGAYGMPHSPMPYDQLTAYEQQQLQARSGRPAPSAYDEQQQQNPKNRRDSDAVFY